MRSAFAVAEISLSLSRMVSISNCSLLSSAWCSEKCPSRVIARAVAFSILDANFSLLASKSTFFSLVLAVSSSMYAFLTRFRGCLFLQFLDEVSDETRHLYYRILFYLLSCSKEAECSFLTRRWTTSTTPRLFDSASFGPQDGSVEPAPFDRSTTSGNLSRRVKP